MYVYMIWHVSCKGVWLGVEWDDPTRGKHSGEHEGVSYFKTQVPESGSFVRPKKVDLGCSFMEAFRNVRRSFMYRQRALSCDRRANVYA